MTPGFASLYEQIVTDEYSRGQLDLVVNHLRKNAAEGKCTLFHCTAGKDRTGIVSMALLKSYGVADKEIIRDTCEPTAMLSGQPSRNAWVCCY